jgi:MraZ protein
VLFLSTFTNKLDRKGRLSVPASYRHALEKEEFRGVVLFPSCKVPALEACSYSRMEKLSSSVDSLDLFSDAQDDLTSSLFASAQPLTFDGEGRITLPADFIALLQVTDEISIVGRGATFQLWQPAAFRAHQEVVRERTRQTAPVLKLTP